jgi:hypothetical protein
MTIEQTLETKHMQTLTKDEAIKLVQERVLNLPENFIEGPITADMMSCIDDRKTDNEARIRIPGAGLGVLMDTLGAGLNLTPEQVTSAVEKALGGKISYHTDKAHEGDELKYAGCGHCAGALKDPQKYLLNDESLSYLNTNYLPQLDEKSGTPEVYEGSHNAKGVMVVDGPITMTSSSDDMVYVYHPTMHRKAIDQIAKEIAELHELNANDVAEAIWKSAQERLGHTVHHLADGLPQFKVTKSESGEIEVTELSH